MGGQIPEPAAASENEARQPAPGATRPPRVRQIPVELIDTPKRPVRRFLGDVAALAESMQDYGLQQPISLRANGKRFMLTSGLRRLAASRLLRWTHISAFVRTVSADDAYVLDLIENLQREDLSPEEEADAFGELIRTRGWTIQLVADSVKRSIGYISKRVRIFEDPLLRDAVVRAGLAVSTAEELLAARADARPALVERAVAERWDQVRARAALRTLAEVSGQSAGAAERAATDHAGASTATPRYRPVAPVPATDRPKGFARAIRAFHKQLVEIRVDDLTQADRAALRALFRDLLLLARAPEKASGPIFPPLPEAPRTGGSKTVTRARRNVRKR